MAKDPSFPFYAKDFLVDTFQWKYAHMGLHMQLLSLAWINGFLEANENGIPAGLDDEESIQLWERVGLKWVLKDGKFFNERLEEERMKRTKFKEKQSENGKKGGRKAKNNPNDKPNETQTETQTKAKIKPSITITNINTEEKKTKEILFVLENKNQEGEEELWDQVKLTFTNDFNWTEKFCRDKNLSPPRLKSFMKQFIDDLELKEEYKDLKELKRHFTNWYNKNVKNFKSESNGDATEFVERLNREKTERILSGGK